MKRLAAMIGLHPVVAFGMVGVDMLLFGPDAGGVTWIISLIVGLALIIPCFLMQKFAYHDSWVAAAGKALVVGILTAIPTPLPSILTGAGGLLGLLGDWSGRKQEEVYELEEDVEDERVVYDESKPDDQQNRQ